ncbi:hypothetical protein [Pseudaestuariivita rosea]|uniref:hypothetical protein n=1 Tax=Pseudaestuariivita rosea TaxID=2763263 RepID=UPI001ABAC281|nr:hypothetical protein [Pseudaestuariivita rosea]
MLNADDTGKDAVLSHQAKQQEIFRKLGMLEKVAEGAGVCISIKKKDADAELLANAAWQHSKTATHDLLVEKALVRFADSDDYDHIAVAVDPTAGASLSDETMTDLTYRAIEIVGLIQAPSEANDLDRVSGS